MNTGRLLIRLAPWLYTVALFAIWEAVCRIFEIPQFFLPPAGRMAYGMLFFAAAVGFALIVFSRRRIDQTAVLGQRGIEPASSSVRSRQL